MRKGKDKATYPKGAPRTPGSLRREGAEPDPKVRKCDVQPLRSGKDRRLHWRIQQRRQWQSYKRQGTERTQVEVRLAVAESLKPFLAREGKQESEDGWAISEEGLEMLTQRGWSDPNFLVGRYAGRAMMDFLRAGKEGTVLFPWAEPTAGHVMEALDRTDDVPLLIPSIHMYRTYGRTITKDCWVAMRIASKEKAEAWRAKSGQYFRVVDEAKEARSVRKIADVSDPLLDDEIDPKGAHPAAKLYRALKDTVLGEAQSFSSVALGQDDPEEEEESWKALEPPGVSESKTPIIQGSRETLAEYIKGKSDNFCPELLNICWKNRRLFDKIRPGSVMGHAHRIDLNTAKELKAMIYPLKTGPQKDAARAEIERLLKDGMIAEIKASQFQAPIVMAPKKSADGKQAWRFCCDFRLLNEHTVSDKYPMPSLERQLDVGKAKYFTKMDLASAFWQVPIAPEDQHKTTFHFEGRSYKWLVMPFGLKNAPPTFQRLVDRILADLLGRGVYAYIGDILIYTETMEEHWTLLGEVLERIRAAGLKISLDKSEWLRKEVQYLGYVIGQGVLKMDPSKTEDILRIPILPDTREEGRYKPDLRKQVRRFLGATGFYRKFIRDYATVTAPLTELTKTTERIKWMPEHTHAWKALQEAMASHPVLRQPDSGKEYYVDTDASNTGLGAALMQRGDDGTLHPTAYASRKLTPVERTYSTREQEALAIVFAIEKFECYLAGRRFTVVTDHRSLSWLMTQPMVKGRLANWAYKLRNHDFTIVYRRGSENHLADFLSRAVNMVRVLPVQVTPSEWVRKERHRAAVLQDALEVVDNGKPRPSRPARTISMPTKVPKARAKAPRQASAYPLTASTDGVGEGFAGALPCSSKDAKAEKRQAPEEQKPGPPTDVKSEEKPAEAKVGGKWLKLSPEEKDRVRNWNLPGLQSWRMRTKGDPGLGPLLQYLTNDAALSPRADVADLERQATKISVENGLLVRKTKGKDGESVLELVVPNISRINLLAEAHDRSHRSIDHTYNTLKEAGGRKCARM